MVVSLEMAYLYQQGMEFFKPHLVGRDHSSSMPNHRFNITYKHWLPLITRCPVNGLLDICYVEVRSPDMVDLYKIRKIIHSYFWKKEFMEDVAAGILDRVSQLKCRVTEVKMTLLFNRHKITVTGGEEIPVDE